MINSVSDSVLSEAVCQEIEQWLAKYPPEQRRSAVIPALHIVQDDNQGWLSPAHLDAVASYLQIPKVAVYEVATFYSMFELRKVGRNLLAVCTNISCMLCGSDSVVAHLKEKLGIDFGESTTDGKFYLKEVECLAACAGAPAMLVNKTYHEGLSPEKIDNILDKLE